MLICTVLMLMTMIVLLLLSTGLFVLFLVSIALPVLPISYLSIAFTIITICCNVKLFVLVHRCVHGRCSPLLQQMFCCRSAGTHTTVRTRAQDSLRLIIPAAGSRYGYTRIAFIAAERWNLLPASVRSCSAHQRFTQGCLQFLGVPVRRP